MTDADRIDHAEDLRRQMREALATAAMSPAVRKRKLLLWVVRQVLLCALAWYFWEKPWMRWVFGIGIVLALVHLAMILLMPRFLTAKGRSAQASFDRMTDVMEQQRMDRSIGQTEAESDRG